MDSNVVEDVIMDKADGKFWRLLRIQKLSQNPEHENVLKYSLSQVEF